MKAQVYETHSGLTVGDEVKKITGKTKFVGLLLAIYTEPSDGTLWCVVRCHESEYTGHLQHLYPLRMFQKV